MRIKNKLHLDIFAFLFALLLFAGCSNSTQNKKGAETAAQKTYILQGSVALSNSGRSATTSFAKLDNMTYRVTAYNDESETYTKSNPAVAKLVEEEGNLKYSFEVKDAGTWVITASAIITKENNTTLVVMSNSKSWIVAENAVTVGVEKIVLNVQGYIEDVKGSIDLTIYDNTNKVEKVSIKAKALITSLQSGEDALKKTFEFSGTYTGRGGFRTANIKLDDVIPNCYEITFNFVDNKDKILYSCKEAVTVFGGYKTDKWVNSTDSNNSHLVYDSDLEETKFVISNQLLQGYNQAGDLNYPIILWNARSDENVPYVCEQEVNNERSVSFLRTQKTRGDPYPEGIKAFGKLEGGSTISSSMGNFTKAFCFDNHEDPPVIYVLNDSYEEIYIYKQSYASFKEEDSIDLNSIINERLDEGTELDSIYPAIAYSNPYVFFFFKTVQDAYYLGAIDVSAADPSDPDNFIFCDTNRYLDNIISMDVDVVNGTTIICYAAESVNEHENEIYIRGLKFEGDTISFDESINSTVVVEASNLGITLPGDYISLDLTDLQILNDILYIALSMHGGPSDMYTGGYVKINNEYIKKPIVISNGGIAKIDLANPEEGGIYPFDKWGNNQILLGWRTGLIYSNNQGSNPRTVTLPPYPYNDDDVERDDTKFFYGARKFIARKPDELVVADDGGYLDIEYKKDDEDNLVLGTVNSVNKNRVVTVNLASETLSAIDVDVTFDKAFALFDNTESYVGTGFEDE